MVDRILIVDDDEGITKLLEIYLQHHGYETRSIYDGNSAITIAKEWEPDLILLDIMMPHVDGYTTCQHIRENLITSHIPVIMLTAKDRMEDKVQGFTVGANDYITKPFENEELRIRIEAHISRTRALQVLSNDELRRDVFDRKGMPQTVAHLDPYSTFDPQDWLPSESTSSIRVSVVLPALNEAENLPHVLPWIPSWVSEIILVDGNSTDDTVELACSICPDIIVLKQEGRGKGAALREGLLAASGDIVVMLDADGSTDPIEIPGFVGALLSGADFAKGSRFLQGGGTLDMPAYRKVGNWALTQLVNVLFGSRYTDITYGYNAVWKKYVPLLALEVDGWSSEIITSIRVVRHGLRVAEVSSIENDRVEGEAKLRAFSAGWVILMGIISERFRKLEKQEVFSDAEHSNRKREEFSFMHLSKYLFSESLRMFRHREEIPPGKYDNGVEILKSTYTFLISMPTSKSEKRLQRRYASISPEQIFMFMENNIERK